MIVRDDQLGAVNMTTPKVVIVEVTPSPTATSASTNLVGVVLQATRGIRGEIGDVGSLAEFEKKFGGYDPLLDGYLWVKRFFDANGSLLKVSRAMSTGGVKASVIVDDGDTPTPLDLYTITANSEGTWGNNITHTAKANPNATGYFDVVIKNTATNEQATYTKTTLLSTDPRYLQTLVANDPNKFFTITGYVNGTPDFTVTSTLVGGTNGTTSGSGLSDSEYVGADSSSLRTGIQAFKSSTCDGISIVQSARNTSTINTALLTHVEDLTLSPRRTILNMANGTSVATAITTRASIDTDKAKIAFPNVKVVNPFSQEIEVVGSNCFDSAQDSLLSYHQSASQTATNISVIGTEIDLSPAEIDALTTVQINPTVFKNGRGFIRASDYTLSSNPQLKQNVVRKAKDFFARTFDFFLQSFISKPITPALWREINDALTSFLRIEASNGRIGSSTGGTPYSVKIDSSNNPPDIVKQNKIIIEVEISLLAPADIIILKLDARQDKTIVNA